MAGNYKVVWSEGMFLQPQHFQQHDRYLECLVEGRAAPLLAYGWGFSHLELDGAALALGKLRLAAARGIFPDGTPFDFPQRDLPPVPLEIAGDVRAEQIVLALPLRDACPEEVNLGAGREANLARYDADKVDVTDTTTRDERSTVVQVGRLRLRLMRQRDATDAYTTLGVVQVQERRADNRVVLHKSYIPPLLHAHANAVLSEHVHDLCGNLHQRGELCAGLLVGPTRGGVAEVADFLLLQTINRYEPVLAHLAAHSLLHPERLYATCLALAGDLATFEEGKRRPSVFPQYKHDSLEQCFVPLLAEIVRLLMTLGPDRKAIPIELQDRNFGVRIAIIPDKELLKTASFVLAVNAQVPAETLRTRFPALAKVGPAERIREFVNLALPAIPLNALPVVPRQLPFHAGFSYFELDRSSDLWKQLDTSRALAIYVQGEFPGLAIELWAIKS